MTPDDIERLFTRNGAYAFARWGRPIAPVVFGVNDATLAVLRGALEAVAQLAGRPLAETDPELGSNLMIFFFREWDELLGVPDLGELVPDLPATVARLKAADANRYRAFRYDEAGAIRAGFVFLAMRGGLENLPAETIAFSEAVETVLAWGEAAFAESAPVARHPETGATVVKPEIAAVIRAAYDPVLPDRAEDPSHALRLFARIGREWRE
ncbi:MAG: hypothetical protein CSA74_00435 [Rhodobacterales bacterium]|nr:MAG: hypothetical protein CSA74_00435 [Rhodobacterales bacterium]